MLENYITEGDHPRVDYHDKVCVKPWGHEFLAMETPTCGAWVLTIRRGHATSLHCHFEKDTLMIVLDGTAKVVLDGERTICMPATSSIFIPRRASHGVGALSETCTILEIELYSDSVTWSDKNDLLRISDDQYKRSHAGYESSVQLDTDVDKYGHFNLEKDGVFHVGSTRIESVTVSQVVVDPKDTHTILIGGTVHSRRAVLREGTMLSAVADSDATVPCPVRLLRIRRPEWSYDAKVIHSLDHLRHLTRQIDEKIVLTSGCFDIVHPGHMDLLRRARDLGDVLIVCLSSDAQITELKGEGRPINKLHERIDFLKMMPYIDYIVLYDESNSVTQETLGQIMRITKPYSWVKGGDYDETLIRRLHPYLTRIDILELRSDYSSSRIIERAAQSSK